MNLPDCLLPPRWIWRGDLGSWPNPELWALPGRRCLEPQDNKEIIFLIYHLILSCHSIITNVQNDYCKYYSSIYTKVPFIWFNFIYRAPHTIKWSLGALLRRPFIFHKSKKKKLVYPTCRFEELLSWSKDDVTVSVCAEEQSHQGSTICHANPHVFVQESF